MFCTSSPVTTRVTNHSESPSLPLKKSLRVLLQLKCKCVHPTALPFFHSYCCDTGVICHLLSFCKELIVIFKVLDLKFKCSGKASHRIQQRPVMRRDSCIALGLQKQLGNKLLGHLPESVDLTRQYF